MNTKTRNNSTCGEAGRTPGGKAGRTHRKDRRDLYQDVTDKIVKQLEASAVPWVQPWSLASACTPFGLPENGHTKNTYSGINILLL